MLFCTLRVHNWVDRRVIFLQRPITAAHVRDVCERFNEGLRVEYKRALDDSVRRVFPFRQHPKHSRDCVFALHGRAVNLSPPRMNTSFSFPNPRLWSILANFGQSLGRQCFRSILKLSIRIFPSQSDISVRPLKIRFSTPPKRRVRRPLDANWSGLERFLGRVQRGIRTEFR